MARTKNNAPPTRCSARLGTNTNNPSASEDPSIAPPAPAPAPAPPPPPPQEVQLPVHPSDVQTKLNGQRAPKRKHQDNEPAIEEQQEHRSASGIDTSAGTTVHAQSGKKLPVRKSSSKAKKTKKIMPSKPAVASVNDEGTLVHIQNTVGGMNSPQASASLPSFGSLPAQPAHVVQGFIHRNVRQSSIPQAGRQEDSPPPVFVHCDEPAQSLSKPAPTFFGSVPAQSLSSDRTSVGERLLRLQSLMAQRNAALDQPLTPIQPLKAPKSDAATKEANQGSNSSFSLPVVSCGTSVETAHRAKRLKTAHRMQSDSPLKQATTHREATTLETSKNALLPARPLQPKPFTPLFPSPQVPQSSAPAEHTNLSGQEPSAGSSPPGTPPPCPTPPTTSLLPYQTASQDELPAPTDDVFLMVGRTHPDYPDYAFNSRVIGQVFPRPTGYTPTGFERFTTFWRQGMDVPLLIPPTHTTSGVITGHLPHVKKDWQDLHRFLARRRASTTVPVGSGDLPPSSPPPDSDASAIELPGPGSNASVIESPGSGSDFEDTQLELRQRGKRTSLSSPSSEEEIDELATPIPSKRTRNPHGKGKKSNIADEGKQQAEGGEGQHPDEPVELTHDERTSIFDLESRLSTFADGLNIEWYQVLEMVGIAYEPNGAPPPGAPQGHLPRAAYHPHRAHVFPLQPASHNIQESSRRQRKRQRQRTRSKSPLRTHFGSDEESEHQCSTPLQHSTTLGDAQQQSRRQQRKRRRLREASNSSRCISSERGQIGCQPSPPVRDSVDPPEPTTIPSGEQVTIDDAVRQVVELAQVFGVHPFELLRWGGVSDPDNDEQPQAPRRTRFGNPYTIFAQYRSIQCPRTKGMSIGQWQQETAADYKERYGHFKKDQLEQESQKWVKAVREHDLRTGDSHAVSRYNNSDSVKSFKKAINDLKNLARRIVKYGKDIHIVAAVYSTDSIAQQASTIISSDSCIPNYVKISKLSLREELDRLATFSRASAMGFLGSSRLEEPWVFGETSEVAQQDSNNTSAIPPTQSANSQCEGDDQPTPGCTSQALDKTAQARTQSPGYESPSSPNNQSVTISNDPQTHLDAFKAGLRITFPTGAGEKRTSVLGRDAGKAFNQVLDNCLRTRHRLRGWDSTVTPSPGDPGFDPNRLSVDVLSQFYKSVREGKQNIWLEEWTKDEKAISRSDREYERIPVVVDSNNKPLRYVHHCPSFLRKQVKSEVTSVVDNLTQNAPIINRARAQVNARKLADSFANVASQNSDPLADIRSLLTSIANLQNTGLPSTRPQGSAPQPSDSTLVPVDPPVGDAEEEKHLTLPVAGTALQEASLIASRILAHSHGLEGEGGFIPPNVKLACTHDLHQAQASIGVRDHLRWYPGLVIMLVDLQTVSNPTAVIGRQYHLGIVVVEEVHSGLVQDLTLYIPNRSLLLDQCRDLLRTSPCQFRVHPLFLHNSTPTFSVLWLHVW
ncbi:hypothetical protein BKA70DRAFT_1236602 [Coprinopsis sp. MPI-PUGE-AT-0042]|nr:hypothetical protein BKA70DRAFT_1236602 [Coprinopsis sp. MPI-PUGE-AT-0042]